jgi:hypothetical protein
MGAEATMDEIVTRFFGDLVGRVDGPMNIRLICQPLLAILFAIRDGARDGREGRVPYFWALFTQPGHRRTLLRSGWKSTGRIFVMAMIVDAIYQIVVLRWFYPGEAVVTATVLAIIPYLMLRGLVNRLTGLAR